MRLRAHAHGKPCPKNGGARNRDGGGHLWHRPPSRGEAPPAVPSPRMNKLGHRHPVISLSTILPSSSPPTGPHHFGRMQSRRGISRSRRVLLPTRMIAIGPRRCAGHPALGLNSCFCWPLERRRFTRCPTEETGCVLLDNATDCSRGRACSVVFY